VDKTVEVDVSYEDVEDVCASSFDGRRPPKDLFRGQLDLR
jgi:hypothetical protein